MDPRREILIDRLNYRKEQYIFSLANISPNVNRWEREASYLDGAEEFIKQQKSGTLPIPFRILENIRDSSRARLNGDESTDEVYHFLLEIKERIYSIVEKEYKKSHASSKKKTFSDRLLKELDSAEVGENKNHFLENLISSFEHRTSPKFFQDEAYLGIEDGRVNSQERYDFLLDFAKRKDKVSAMKDLVNKFPSYPWEKCDW
jgi:hypothetical protein